MQLDNLGPRLVGSKVDDPESALVAVSKIITLSDTQRELLLKYGGELEFRNGAKFKCECAYSRPDGWLTLLSLFGLGELDGSILSAFRVYEDQLPQGVVPIGEVIGTNVLCQDQEGKIWFWHHEGIGGEELSLVADSFDAFIAGVRPNEEFVRVVTPTPDKRQAHFEKQRRLKEKRLLQKFEDLGMKPTGGQISGTNEANANIDGFTPSFTLLFIWQTYKCAVDMGNGVILVSSSPASLPKYELTLDTLFGPGDGTHSAAKQYELHRAKLPAGYIPIGAIRGGHLLCQTADDKVYVWDATVSEGDVMFRVATTFEGFFRSLQPRDA